MSFFNSHSNFNPCLRPKGDSLLPLERTLDRALCAYGTVQPKPKRLPWHSDFTTLQLSTALNNLLDTPHQGDAKSNRRTGGACACFCLFFLHHLPLSICNTNSVRPVRRFHVHLHAPDGCGHAHKSTQTA